MYKRYGMWVAAAIGHSWRDRAGSIEYLQDLAPKVEHLMTEIQSR